MMDLINDALRILLTGGKKMVKNDKYNNENQLTVIGKR